MEIANRLFVISGGASGLGLATAERLVQANGYVLLIDKNKEAGEKAQSHLGENALFMPADVRSEADILHALEQIPTSWGNPYGLINCAGLGTAKRVVGKDGPQALSDFATVIEINLIGSFNLIRLCVHRMQHNVPDADGQRGIVINTASVAAFDGQIGQAAYAASKGGIVAMTLPLAREFARMGIRVMCIAPGIFETPLLANLPAEVQESLGQQVPFPKRLGKPAEFASLALQMIENTMLNGEVVRLDGAIRMTAQ